MTIIYNTVQEVYNRNYGSERLYKRNYCNTLSYTQGIMDFQQTLNAFWVVDNVVSYMPKILKAFEDNTFSFFVIEIALNKKQQGYMEVFTEDYVGVYIMNTSLSLNKIFPLLICLLRKMRKLLLIASILKYLHLSLLTLHYFCLRNTDIWGISSPF